MAITREEFLRELRSIVGSGTTPSGRGTPGRTDTTGMSAEEIERLEKAREIYDKLDRLSESRRANESEALRNAKEALKASNQAFDQQRRLLEEQLRLGTITEDNYKQQLQSQIDSNEQARKYVDTIREGEQAAEGLAGSFGSIFSGKAPDLKGMLDPKNIQGMAKKIKSVGMGMSMAQMASMAAVEGLMAYTKAAIDLVFKLDEMEVGFMKATGVNRDFARSITDSYQETRKFGATAEQTAAAAQGLFDNFTDFTMVSEDARKNLVKTSAVLEKMGVSNAAFGKSIQLSTKALGMSADQAAQNMLNLEKFAENLGVAPAKLAEEFAGAGDMVAKLGANGTKAFKDLQVVMKVTGMSMDSILGITNKFDTFEGAAGMAGKLNAALGGDFVNAMDLMMATNPAERFEMIRDSILDTGLSFDDMSYYQKQFYTDSLNLKDVGELALMMSGDIELMDGAVQQSGQSMVDAAKRARDLATIQEKLQIAFAQLIPIITPLIDAFSQMAGFVADNMDVIKPLIGVLIILGSIFGLIIPEAASTAAGIAGVGLGVSILFDSIETGGESLTMLGAVFEGFGEVFSDIYSLFEPGIKALKDWMSEMQKNKETMENLHKIGKVIGYVIGVVLVGSIVSATAAFIGITWPLLQTAITIGAVIASIYKLAEVFWETPFNPPNFLQGLIEIANAFAGIAEKAMTIINPFAIVERSITAVGNTFSSILGGVTGFFDVLTDPAAVENIKAIAKAISEVDPIGAGSYTAAMTATAAAQTAGTAKAAVEGASQAVSNVFFGGSENKSDKKQEITINLMLDREKLATVVRQINGKSAVAAAAGRG